MRERDYLQEANDLRARLGIDTTVPLISAEDRLWEAIQNAHGRCLRCDEYVSWCGHTTEEHDEYRS